MRSGTSSLNSYLRDHPEVAVSRPKEVHYFDVNFDLGPEWYLAHFEGSEHATAVGEATPDYLYDLEAPGRIAAVVPGVRILLLLRDPAERAYSHYWHNVAVGKESLGFEEALAAEPERIAGGSLDRAGVTDGAAALTSRSVGLGAGAGAFGGGEDAVGRAASTLSRPSTALICVRARLTSELDGYSRASHRYS